MTSFGNVYLSYDVVVIQWIMSYHINCMTTRVITHWRERVTSMTTSMSTMRFRYEIMFILKAIKSHFKESYDIQNLTLMVISYGIHEMTTCVRSSISIVTLHHIILSFSCYQGALFRWYLQGMHYYMGFSLSSDLSARYSNIGPRAWPRSDIGRGLIDRVLTKPML